MIVATAYTYDEFKAKFLELGGTRRTIIVFNRVGSISTSPSPSPTWGRIAATIAAEVVLTFVSSIAADLETVEADFPQAVHVSIVQYGDTE